MVYFKNAARESSIHNRIGKLLLEKPFLWAFLVAALLCYASAQDPVPSSPNPSQPASSQEPPGSQQDSTQPTPLAPNSVPDNGRFVFKTRATEVVLHVTVVDAGNRPVTGLDRSAFTVYENGKLQRVTSFHVEDVPVALGLVIDNSGSMSPMRLSVNRAAINLVRASNPRDGVFVVNFGENYYLDQDFTSDVGKLEQALAKVDTRGSTAVYDALVASANHLNKNVDIDKKILLLITDGKDNASQETLQETLHQLQQRNGPIIYVIALLGDKDRPQVRSTLEAIARETGGTSFFPENLEEVDAISRTIARDIRSQYTINYKASTIPKTVEYRSIQVVAKVGKEKLQVRTRSGYFGGQEEEPPSETPAGRTSPIGKN